MFYFHQKFISVTVKMKIITENPYEYINKFDQYKILVQLALVRSDVKFSKFQKSNKKFIE